MFLQTMDRKIAVVLFIVALIYLLLSYQLPAFPYTIVDADVLPKGLGYLFVLLSLILFLQNRPETEEQKQKRTLEKQEVIILLSILGTVLLYIFLLEIVGFVINTILFLITTTRVLGYVKWRTNIIVSVLFTLILYFSFNYLLQIYLPQGFLPF
jgi:putative tricarboxylic transport membrane protein